MNQLTLNFEPSLPERFSSLRAYVAHRVTVQTKPAKTIAADMDLSPSALSRKLNPGEADTARFTIDDLEDYIRSTNDAPAVIEYLAAKYMAGGDAARQARALARAEQLMTDLQRALASLKS
jgi:predicted Zn-dependent protease